MNFGKGYHGVVAKELEEHLAWFELKELAKKKKRTMSSMVHEAIDELLHKYHQEEKCQQNLSTSSEVT